MIDEREEIHSSRLALYRFNLLLNNYYLFTSGLNKESMSHVRTSDGQVKVLISHVMFGIVTLFFK